MHSLQEYINIFVTLLAIVDPIGAVPIFVGLTAGQNWKQQAATARVTALAVGLVLISSALFGEVLLGFFGISIASFRVAGGILLLLIGISMLHARQSFSAPLPVEATEAAEKESAAVIPLAIPLLSGPGAISSMTIYSHNDRGWLHIAILSGIGLLIALVTCLTLFLAQPICRTLGRTGVNISIRLMGLLLSAAAVQFISDGLLQLFPVLLRH